MENVQENNDRSELTMLEPWELQYYAFNFACTEEELKAALAVVGNSPSDLSKKLSK